MSARSPIDALTPRRNLHSGDTRILAPSAAHGVWRGAIDWEVSGSASTPWRLDRRDGDAAISGGLAEVAQAAAGVRAEFETDARSARLVLERVDDEAGCVDVVVDAELRERAVLGPGIQTIEFELPGERARIELWLPQAGITRIHTLELRAASRLAADIPPRPRWLVYGSSITHCFEAPGPTATWPARVARALDWDLTCMGFSGQCLLDDVAAETISGSDADIVMICAGINIYNRGEWDALELRRRLEIFLRTVRRGRPDAPIVVVSPIASASRESAKNAAGMTLSDVRALMSQLAEHIDLDDVHYLNGLDVLGIADQGLLHDGLHPSDEGYALMAERLHPIMAQAPFTGSTSGDLPAR